MPTIQSRKYPDNIQFVDAAAWEDMKRKGIARRFNVLDDNDLQETVIPAPESIVNFEDRREIETEDTVEAITEMSRDEIKAKLDEAGIEYNTRLGTEKLLEILNNG